MNVIDVSEFRSYSFVLILNELISSNSDYALQEGGHHLVKPHCFLDVQPMRSLRIGLQTKHVDVADTNA